ncbi:hypothetical protein VTI28DRAFT_3536 [Corynascus sepedonium]
MPATPFPRLFLATLTPNQNETSPVPSHCAPASAHSLARDTVLIGSVGTKAPVFGLDGERSGGGANLCYCALHFTLNP